MAIGLERYLKLSINKKMTADLWKRERLLDVRPDDTQVQPGHPGWNNAYETLKYAYDNYDDLAYVGDKLPRSANSYGCFRDSVPDMKILYMLRNPFDVAASYNKRARNEKDKGWRPQTDYRTAVAHWNLDVTETVKYLEDLQFHVIRYETVFFDRNEFQGVYDFLGLELTDEILDIWQNSRRKSRDMEGQRSALTDEEKVYVCAHSDFGAYRTLLKYGGYLDEVA
jgi:hypothetical protein